MTELPSIFAGIADTNAEHPDFELSDPSGSDSDIQAWLGALPKDGTRFVVFAQDGTGSLYAVWLRPSHDDVDSAPIVYLGSEGEVGVLAKDADAFLDFVAAGLSFDGHRGSFFDPLDSEEDEDTIEDIRARRERVATWVRRQTGRQQLRHPDELRSEAERLYPGFEAWVQANNAYLNG